MWRDREKSQIIRKNMKNMQGPSKIKWTFKHKNSISFWKKVYRLSNSITHSKRKWRNIFQNAKICQNCKVCTAGPEKTQMDLEWLLRRCIISLIGLADIKWMCFLRKMKTLSKSLKKWQMEEITQDKKLLGMNKWWVKSQSRWRNNNKRGNKNWRN